MKFFDEIEIFNLSMEKLKNSHQELQNDFKELGEKYEILNKERNEINENLMNIDKLNEDFKNLEQYVFIIN